MSQKKGNLLSIVRDRSLIVCLLGYLIDQFDLGLFAINRVASLQALGLNEADILTVGIRLLNLQMAGMLVGGIIGGIVGDKKGRVTVLYGSMLIYASANLANAFSTTVLEYAVCRFIAGVGLAAEIGASLTILSELLPGHLRGRGMMFLIALGHAGGILASVLGSQLDWRTNYFIGGLLGFALFALRLRVHEPGLYQNVRSANIELGNPKIIFTSAKRTLTFLKGIAIGLPVYEVSGILLAFAPEIAKAMGVVDPISPALTFPCYYAAVIAGDFASGLLSWKLRSEKKSILFMQLILLLGAALYFAHLGSAFAFYAAVSVLGFASGHWVLVNLVATEQFGTNIRATVATATPNFIRASVIIMTSSFSFLRTFMATDHAALIVTGVCLLLSLPSIVSLPETYGKDLDFTS